MTDPIQNENRDMHDQLIGYLLNALDDEETREVERRLEQDATARRTLELLRTGLVPLEVDREPCELPANLAAKTCQHLRSLNAAPRDRSPPRP